MISHGRLKAVVLSALLVWLSGCTSYSGYQPVRLNEERPPAGSQAAEPQPAQRTQPGAGLPQNLTRDNNGFPVAGAPNGQNQPAQPDPQASYYEVYNPTHPSADARGYVRYYAHPPVVAAQAAPTAVLIQPGTTTQASQPATPAPAGNNGYWSSLPTRRNANTPSAVRVLPIPGHTLPVEPSPFQANPNTSPDPTIANSPDAAPANPVATPASGAGLVAINSNPTPPAQRNSTPAAARIDDPPTIDQVTYYLERLVGNNPQDVSAQLALRLLYAAQGDADRALTNLPTVADATQEPVLELARTVILTSGALQRKDDPVVANRALEAVEELRGRIAEQADMQIANLKICSQVEGFGQYQELNSTVLADGQPRSILVYCELDNFTNGLNADKKYYTSIHASITLYDAGLNALTQLSAPVSDKPSFNKRRDFFLRGPLQLPKLTPGKYEIVTVIEDKLANKRAMPWRYQFEVKPTSQTAQVN